MYIYYNDNLTEEAFIAASSQGFQYGRGVFETLLFEKGHTYFLEEHCERLQKSLEKLGLRHIIDLDELYRKAAVLGQKNKMEQGRLKLMCFKDTAEASLLMTLTPYEPDRQQQEKGVRLNISTIKRNPYSPLTYIKSMNYADNILAREEAQTKGFHEALLLNVYNKLCEGAMSNLFWIKDHIVYTPDVSCGLLEGIVRKKVIDLVQSLGIRLEEGSYELTELLTADEVFITNSLIGIIPVAGIEDTNFELESFTHREVLQKEYKNLMKQDFGKRTGA